MAGMYGCFKNRNSDSAAMASGAPDVMANQESADVVEECSGKKKSKFQTFKKFFSRKKRKEPPAAGADAGLKASQSSDNVSKTSENNTLTRSEKDKGSGSKISLGSKALSHDSVFVSDLSEANEALGASQDSIHGKVKSLQLQLKQAIRLGSPPSLMCVKKTDDAGTVSEDDGLPCSPPEYTTLHAAMNQAQRNSSISLEGTESDDDQLSCAASSGALSPLVVPGDFSLPASPFGCLDNSAAKHKLGLRHKACNRRKPVCRLEMKAEGDSVVEETLNTSITEASEALEQQKTSEAVSVDELKPKVDREEEEEEEEDEEEEEQPQHSRPSLVRDEEEREEGEDESEAEQDVSPGPDSSSPPELCHPDAQPLASSKPSSRASSLDSPGATPEPPAGLREYLLDPPGVADEAEEKGYESDSALSGEEDQESREEESSFLQEVLSSLKTPLASCLGTEDVVLETEGVVLETEEEEKEQEREDVEIVEGDEVKEEEAEVDEPVGYQAGSDHTTQEVVSTLSTTSCQDVEEEEKVEEKEEEEQEQEEAAEEEEATEEEELVVEHVSQHGQEEEGEKDEAEEISPEERHDTLTGNAVDRAEEEEREEEEEEESEGEEEAIELETKEPAVEEEGREKKEEDDEEVKAKEAKERVAEAMEDERDDAKEMTETFPEEKDAVSLQEEEEGVAVGDVNACTNNAESELGGQQVFAVVHGSQTASDESFGEERGDGKEKGEEGVDIDSTEQKSEQEGEGEAKQPDADLTEQDLQREGVETSHLDMNQSKATEQAKPPSLFLPEPRCEAPSLESGASTPSKTSTIHINLLSPSSEKATPFFPQSPTAESETPCHAVAATQQNAAATEEGEEPADNVETVEVEKPQASDRAATPPASVEEDIKPPSIGSDQSRARFTVAPVWQRSLSVGDAEESLIPPSSPPACVSHSPSAVTGPGGVEVEAEKDPEVKAEPSSSAKVELVLSPGRVRNTGTGTASSSPSSVQPQTSAAAKTDKSSVVVEGNPDNPFGVRLRKTSAPHRFSSEEENTEPPIEPPAQPTSCRLDSPQPISGKPSISQSVSNKPALPKKPDVHGDSVGKSKRISDQAAGRGFSAGSDSPSWISVAKQKQKIYKENSLEEITIKKEEPESKSSLPMSVSSAASREPSNRTAESTGKVSPLEIRKPSASVEKEARRALSPPTPVPPQPPKPQSLPCPAPPKPQLPPAAAKHPAQPNSPQRSLSPPTPIPVQQKSPACISPPPPSKTATSSKTPPPQGTTLSSPPFSLRTAPEKSGSRAPGLSSQTPASQRGPPPPASPQDEPPWMALAKKKAKAWSEMPQIVQ